MSIFTRPRNPIEYAVLFCLAAHLALGDYCHAEDSPLKAEKEQVVGVSELTKEQLLKHVPNFFYFDYQFEPKPGKRYWLRIDNKTWLERYPDGEETKFEILGRTSVNDCVGIIIQKTSEKTFQVFVPDKGSEQMWLRFRHTQVSDKWSNLAEMMKVE